MDPLWYAQQYLVYYDYSKSKYHDKLGKTLEEKRSRKVLECIDKILGEKLLDVLMFDAYPCKNEKKTEKGGETFYESCGKCDHCKAGERVYEAVLNNINILDYLIDFFLDDLPNACKKDNEVFLEYCNYVINKIIENGKICINSLSEKKHLTAQDVENQYKEMLTKLCENTLKQFSDYFNINKYQLISKKLQYMSNAELRSYFMACNLQNLHDICGVWPSPCYKNHIYNLFNKDDWFKLKNTQLLQINEEECKTSACEIMTNKTLNIIEDDNFLKENCINSEQSSILSKLTDIVNEYIDKDKNKDLFNYINNVINLLVDINDINKMKSKHIYPILLLDDLKISVEDLNKIVDINDNDLFTTKEYKKLKNKNQIITWNQLCYYLSNKLNVKLISFKYKLHELLSWYSLDNIDPKLTESTIREFVDSYKNSIQCTINKFNYYLKQKLLQIIHNELNDYKEFKKEYKLADDCSLANIENVIKQNKLKSNNYIYLKKMLEKYSLNDNCSLDDIWKAIEKFLKDYKKVNNTLKK